jgi:CHAT domain-containing protein
MDSTMRWTAGAAQRTLLVAGPGLTEGAAEVHDLAGVYPHAEVLLGAQATSTAFLRAAANAELVHVAAHGSFRADNPLLSALRLMDGPLTVYDLEGMGRSPRCLVLSACDSGLSAVRPGEELMGLSAALLRAGTCVLVASVMPARDTTTRALMVHFHRGLQAGREPAVALAEAQHTLSTHPADEPLAVGGFVCFGGGVRPD